MKIFGPYVHSSGSLKGRRYVSLLDEQTGRSTTKLYSRWLMEEKLGRELAYDETVDHINEDPTDDRIENLQVISRKVNARKTAALRRRIVLGEYICPECGIAFEKDTRDVRSNQGQKGKAGPFCGRSCAGKYGKRIQMRE